MAFVKIGLSSVQHNKNKIEKESQISRLIELCNNIYNFRFKVFTLIKPTSFSNGIDLLFIYLFLNFWLLWVLVAAHGLSLVAASRGYSSLWCAGFSLQWLLLLRNMGSRQVGFSSCGLQAQLLYSMWDLPGPAIEPVSPALAGGFMTTGPPGKSLELTL